MTVDNDRIIYELWKLLDNIDTLSDICKDDYKLFSKLVHDEQQKRWGIIEEKTIDEIYDKYHPKEEEE